MAEAFADYGNEVSHLKTPPWSLQAEQGVIGGIMLDNSKILDVEIIIEPADFFRREHQIIYQAMVELSILNRPCDVVTLSDEMEKTEQLEEAGGLVYLAQLANDTASAANVRYYAETVKEHATVRRIISAAVDIADKGYQRTTARDLIEFSQSQIMSIDHGQRGRKSTRSANAIIPHVLDKIERRAQGIKTDEIKTGYTDLDARINAIAPGNLIILAGRPSMGKTTLAMNIASNVAKDKAVQVFSLEMTEEELIERSIANLGRVPLGGVISGRLEDSEWPRVTSAIAQISESKLFINEQSGLTVNQVKSEARRQKMQTPDLSLIVIDYLQMLNAEKDRNNRNIEIEEITRALKGLAKELGVPIILLSQLNRSLETRQNKRPIMSDLRDSGAIEQDADLILFVYREEVYTKHLTDSCRGVAEIIIGKQRNGALGTVFMTFQGQYNRFDNYAGPEPDYAVIRAPGKPAGQERMDLE